MKTILIVDDDDKIRELLGKYLTMQGFNVLSSRDGLFINEKIKNVDLIILDIMMPEISGFDVMTQLSLINSEIPVIFLSARSENESKIKGLELGADDFITKPFNPQELLLRINNILKRNEKKLSKISGFLYDEKKGILIDNNLNQIELTTTENIIFQLLSEKLNIAVSRDEIIDNFQGTISERSVDVQITRIRKKLGTKSDIIKTVRHNGYMLIDD